MLAEQYRVLIGCADAYMEEGFDVDRVVRERLFRRLKSHPGKR